jgi:hypothetical protein
MIRLTPTLKVRYNAVERLNPRLVNQRPFTHRSLADGLKGDAMVRGEGSTLVTFPPAAMISGCS